MDEDEILPGPGKYNAPTFTVTAPAYLFKNKKLDEDDTFYEGQLNLWDQKHQLHFCKYKVVFKNI